MSHPVMSLCSQDQIATIYFGNDFKVGVAYEMVTTEQTQVVKSYDKPPIKKSIDGQQYFRAEIRESQRQLTPILSNNNCVSYDQSYFTRTIGQVALQKRLEDKFGDFSGKYSLFSGAGFGSIQAVWSALGWKTADLQRFLCVNIRDAIKKGILKKAYELTASVLLDVKFDRFSSKYIQKELKKVFTLNKQPLKIKDLKSDIFIPIQDISGRTEIISKKNQPNMPLYVAVGASLFDPVFFETKKYFNHLGVLNGDVVKNNDILLRKHNHNMNIVAIGSPPRVFDKGFEKISRSDLALKISDQKHETDLIMSSMIEDFHKRYECTPIDEVSQFATDNKSIEAALTSAENVEL